MGVRASLLSLANPQLQASVVLDILWAKHLGEKE
jgi:hypothetical protein